MVIVVRFCESSSRLLWIHRSLSLSRALVASSRIGKPVLVMRNTTERPEAVEAGTVKLVGTDAEAIVSNVTELLRNKELYRRMSETHNPYGDGHACERILSVLTR